MGGYFVLKKKWHRDKIYCSLQIENMKLELLVIMDQYVVVNMYSPWGVPPIDGELQGSKKFHEVMMHCFVYF